MSERTLSGTPLCLAVLRALFNFCIVQSWLSVFSPEEQQLRETIFQNFSDLEFKKLFKFAEWSDIDANTKLVVEGLPVTYLIYITKGGARVQVGGITKARTQPFMFVGEMSFLSGENASATVTTDQVCRCVRWTQESLKSLMISNPAMNLAFKSVIGVDLTVKVKAHGDRADDTTLFELRDFGS